MFAFVFCWILLLEPTAPHRLTPHKFIIPHARASFGPTGRLLQVLPNSPHDGQPALVEIVDIGELLSRTAEADSLRQFPGPLVRYVDINSLGFVILGLVFPSPFLNKLMYLPVIMPESLCVHVCM